MLLRGLTMPTNECCRTCQHCGAGQAVSGMWCRLRRIRVDPEIAPFALCHHWTMREPSLPILDKKIAEVAMDKQLELGRAFVTSDK